MAVEAWALATAELVTEEAWALAPKAPAAEEESALATAGLEMAEA